MLGFVFRDASPQLPRASSESGGDHILVHSLPGGGKPAIANLHSLVDRSSSETEQLLSFVGSSSACFLHFCAFLIKIPMPMVSNQLREVSINRSVIERLTGRHLGGRERERAARKWNKGGNNVLNGN